LIDPGEEKERGSLRSDKPADKAFWNVFYTKGDQSMIRCVRACVRACVHACFACVRVYELPLRLPPDC